jgi:hypothetical protein
VKVNVKLTSSSAASNTAEIVSGSWTWISKSSSSGASDKGDEPLALTWSSINDSGDTDRDMIDKEMLTGDSGGEEGGNGDDGVSTPTSKLLSRSVLRPRLSEGNARRGSTSSLVQIELRMSHVGTGT